VVQAAIHSIGNRLVSRAKRPAALTAALGILRASQLIQQCADVMLVIDGNSLATICAKESVAAGFTSVQAA
jgi:hypothetical protein